MKKHIDLFGSKKRQEDLSPLVVKGKKIGLIVLCVLLVLVLIEVGASFYLTKITEELTQKQVLLTEFLQRNQGLDNKIALFLYKKNLLQRYMKDDAQFSAYYQLFQNILQEAKLDVQLESFSVDKNRSAVFTITFTNYDASQQFIKAIETAVFLDHFSNLTLSSFLVSSRKNENNEEIPVYRLELKGTFKEINANKS